jgi:carbonic anhydrase/acetyltransferase-like protein (isoleucine patch superfamily)
MGVPAKVVKSISEEQKLKIVKNAESYVSLSKVYLEAF